MATITYDEIKPDKTQLDKVRTYIKTHGKITSWEAIKFYKITRLAEYIRQLRNEGLEIETLWGHRNKKRFGIYKLVRNTNEALDHVNDIQTEAEILPTKIGHRTVALSDYLSYDSGKHKAIITSLPDMEETGMKTIEEWKEWLDEVCYKLSSELEDDGVIFFFQTDRKYKGTLIDKKNMITDIFIEEGYNKILSKIVLKQEPETISLFRPSFTNLFAFSRKKKGGKVTPDVFPSGRQAYRNAMGQNAIDCCLNYIEKNIKTDLIYNPFCGSGSVLKGANDRGFHAFGIDIDREQVNKAKHL